MDDCTGARSTPPPILLVDGFTPFPTPYFHIRRFYKKNGRDMRTVPFLLAVTRDVTTYAQHIKNAAARLMRRYDTDRIDIIGYSMGGVATLYAMKRLNLANEVRTFLAYGSPFNGALMSRYSRSTRLCRTLGTQLSPGSEFLKHLHADPLPEGPKYISLYGIRDLICRPRDCMLHGAENHHINAGHWTFVFEARIHRIVLPYLS